MEEGRGNGGRGGAGYGTLSFYLTLLRGGVRKVEIGLKGGLGPRGTVTRGDEGATKGAVDSRGVGVVELRVTRGGLACPGEEVVRCPGPGPISGGWISPGPAAPTPAAAQWQQHSCWSQGGAGYGGGPPGCAVYHDQQGNFHTGRWVMDGGGDKVSVKEAVKVDEKVEHEVNEVASTEEHAALKKRLADLERELTQLSLQETDVKPQTYASVTSQPSTPVEGSVPVPTVKLEGGGAVTQQTTFMMEQQTMTAYVKTKGWPKFPQVPLPDSAAVFVAFNTRLHGKVKDVLLAVGNHG